MRNNIRIICAFCLFSSFLSNVLTMDFEDSVNLYKHLANSTQYRHIKPRIDQKNKVNVDVILSINSIENYDEVSGNLAFTGSFALYWKDETKIWKPSKFGGITATDVPLTETWTPTLLIRNGVDQIYIFRFNDDLGIQKATVTYYYNGQAKTVTSGLYQATCESDVTYYPIDEHKCTVITTTTYLLHDVTLTSKHGIYLKSFIPNAEWFIKDVNTTKTQLRISISKDIYTYQDQIEFTIVIHREHRFPIVNVILPILIVSFVHLLVFLLPVQSGERTSFSFTLFLTLVVFLTIVSEKLPPSDSISVFNVFMIHQLLSSVFTTALTVFSIRIFYKDQDDHVTGVLYQLLLKLYHVSCADSRKRHSSTERRLWRNVSHFFDKLCIWIMSVCFVIQLCIYGVVIAYRKSFLD